MEIRFKAQLMTLLVLILFVLMLAELMIFVAVNVGYNSIGQSLVLSSSSVNYAAELKASASAFASQSLSRALYTLTMYEYTPKLRYDNFITNLSMYISQLMINGTLPNVQQGSYAANALLSYMGNETFTAYNKSIMKSIGTGVALKINQTRPIIFQDSPYSISVRYIENVFINSSAGLYAYSIPVNASIPLNGTYDLLYAQEGILRSIKFSSANNLTSVIGNSHATYGNSFIYGIVLNVPSGVTCTTLPSNVPTAFRSAPLNKSVILATPNAAYITNATCTAANNYGGLVTYSINSISSPPNIPYLIYASGTNVLQQLKNYTKVLLYGPEMDLLNIESLRNAIANGYFFASPFAPSYIDRADASLLKQSQNGIFTFTNYNRQAANFNGQSSYIQIPNANSLQLSTVTFGGWVDYKGPASGNWDWLIAKQNAYGVGVCGSSLDVCFYNWGTGTNYQSSYALTKNTWYYLVAEVANGNETVYVNGNKIFAGPLSVSSQSTVGWQIGYGNAGGQLLNGSAGNIQIYNTTLSASEIQALYTEGIGGVPIANAGLVGWWPLDGNANDYSGFGNNGTATSVSYSLLPNYQRDSIFITPIPGTLQPIPGVMSCDTVAQCNNASLSKLYIGSMPLELQNKFVEAASLNGQSSYIEQSNGFGFMNNAAANFSISIWVYPTSPSGVIVDELGQTTPNSGWHDSWIELVNGNVYVRVWNLACVKVGTISTNTWSNIVMTGSYVNGNFIYEGYINGAFGNSGTGSRSVPGGSSLMYYPLGVLDATNCGSGAYFSGEMSNYQFYNTTLTPSEIAAIYKNGISGLPIANAGLVGWWPLDGNANDYSGFGNNGTATNVFYQRISPQYSLPGLSTITIAGSEQQVLGLG
ncbi:MAG: LamG domain-containing protein [Candidatus Micrarchaeaceae archaeon]